MIDGDDHGVDDHNLDDHDDDHIVHKDNTKAGQVLSTWWKVRAVSYCV